MSKNTIPTTPDTIAAVTDLEVLDRIAPTLPTAAFAAVKYAGNLVDATPSAVDHRTDVAQAFAYAAVVGCGLANSAAAERFGFHHPRAVRTAKYAWADQLGTDLRVRRGARTVAVPTFTADQLLAMLAEAKAPKTVLARMGAALTPAADEAVA